MKERDMAAPDGAFDGDFSGLDLAISSQSGTDAPVDVVDIAVTFADPPPRSPRSSASGAATRASRPASTLAGRELGKPGHRGRSARAAVSSSQPVYANDDDTHLDLTLGDGRRRGSPRRRIPRGRRRAHHRRRLPRLGRRTSAGSSRWSPTRSPVAPWRSRTRRGRLPQGHRVRLDPDHHHRARRRGGMSRSSRSPPASPAPRSSRPSRSVDDQPIALTLQSGGGTWASMALATKFGVLGLATGSLEHLRAGSVGVAQVFSSSLSTTDTATAVSFLQAVAATAALTTGENHG